MDDNRKPITRKEAFKRKVEARVAGKYKSKYRKKFLWLLLILAVGFLYYFNVHSDAAQTIGRAIESVADGPGGGASVSAAVEVEVDPYWTLNFSNFSTLYGNQLGNTSSGISWATANNGTLLNYSRALNGTLVLNSSLADYLKTASWNATNTSYLLTTNTTYAYALNASLWSLNYSNFSIGWLYATNSTGSDSFAANYSNFSRIYANVTDYNTSWSSVTNSSYLTWLHAINGTLLNYTDALNGTLALNSSLAAYVKTVNWNATNTSYFSNISNFGVNLTNAGYCVYNSSIDKLNCSYTAGGSDTFAANYSNFTAVYGYSLNASLWTLNYTDYLAIRTYATNASLWTLNYSTYLLKPTWPQVLNGSLIASDNVTYSYSLNASLWSLNYSNFSIGWLYATNSTGADSFIANFTNFSRMYANITDYNISWSSITNTSYLLTTNTTYAYSLNETLWSANYSAYLTKPTWAQATNGSVLSFGNQTLGNNYITNGTGGAYIYNNGTDWCIGSC